ncbi:hypothetical protein BG20_I0307 [Candidatus Nitrosarchaeum limnium BG20]|uniref:Uncharacterized protein n=1 Tax=Candidatus Nitrosarchaeum limnium BG20 TaxID=859192 RepID=S2E8E0_9ARCH|nr:hypothetical protein BG20_I0307 [Candidatus Nitrosarchaeum limnium BG20]
MLQFLTFDNLESISQIIVSDFDYHMIIKWLSNFVIIN